jgi:carboxylesterase type B
MSNLIVETKLGKVQGKEEISSLGDSYLAFYSIRYAKSPIGILRFKVE